MGTQKLDEAGSGPLGDLGLPTPDTHRGMCCPRPSPRVRAVRRRGPGPLRDRVGVHSGVDSQGHIVL